MGRTICIAGYAPASRDWANKQEDNVEIWTVTEVAQFLLRADRFFQMHSRDWKDEERRAEAKEAGKVFTAANTYGRGQTAISLWKNFTAPLYMNFPEDEFPSSVKFPIDEVAERYGKDHFGKKRAYLTSTPAYMIALALLEHDKGDTVDEIRLAGIELAIGTEYYDQRPCFEYYCGIAVGRGIKMTLPPADEYRSSILGAPVYPLEEPLPKPKDFKSEVSPIYIKADISEGATKEEPDDS